MIPAPIPLPPPPPVYCCFLSSQHSFPIQFFRDIPYWYRVLLCFATTIPFWSLCEILFIKMYTVLRRISAQKHSWLINFRLHCKNEQTQCFDQCGGAKNISSGPWSFKSELRHHLHLHLQLLLLLFLKPHPALTLIFLRPLDFFFYHRCTLKITFALIYCKYRYFFTWINVLVIFCPIHPAQNNLNCKIQCCRAGAIIRKYCSGSGRPLPAPQHWFRISNSTL
jgi:hypothetical protein